mgnify:CR=1 FL=1
MGLTISDSGLVIQIFHHIYIEHKIQDMKKPRLYPILITKLVAMTKLVSKCWALTFTIPILALRLLAFMIRTYHFPFGFQNRLDFHSDLYEVFFFLEKVIPGCGCCLRYEPQTGEKYLVADRASWREDGKDFGKTFLTNT